MKNKDMKKRILAIILCLVMVAGICGSALAEGLDAGGTVNVETESEENLEQSAEDNLEQNTEEILLCEVCQAETCVCETPDPEELAEIELESLALDEEVVDATNMEDLENQVDDENIEDPDKSTETEDQSELDVDLQKEKEEAMKNMMALLPSGAEIPEDCTEVYTYVDLKGAYEVNVCAPEGALPAEAILTVDLLHESSDEYAEAHELLNKEYDSTVALDIRFEVNGEEVEPSKAVYVCINAIGLLPETIDPETVEVHHLKENATTKTNDEFTVEVVADNTEATGVVEIVESKKEEALDIATAFQVDSFSIFVVGGNDGLPDSDEEIEQIVLDASNVGDRGMKVNEEIFLKWKEDAVSTATDVRGVWAVSSGTDVIELSYYDEADVDSEVLETDDPSYKYWYAKVKGLKEGNATVTFTLYTNENSTEGERRIYTINISVTSSGCWILDDIAASGCLVPAGEFIELEEAGEIVSYQWSRSDGEKIAKDALSSLYAKENGVNIAIDKGGVYESNPDKIVIYTLEGLNASGDVVVVDGVPAKASFAVKYGMEVINGDFESPVLPTPVFTNFKEAVEGGINSRYIFKQFPNGYENLYWMTTGTGEYTSTGDMLGHDVEIFTDRYGIMSYVYSNATDGLNYIGTTNVNNLYLTRDMFNNNGTANTDTTEKAGSLTIATSAYSANKTPTYKTYTNNHAGALDADHVCTDECYMDDGNYQAAELNCEAYGALYQDVLTTPGATLAWEVDHAARYIGDLSLQKEAKHKEDHMCVIIMSTEDARHIITKGDVDELLDAVKTDSGESGYIRSSHTSIDDCNCGLVEGCGGSENTYTATVNGAEVSFQVWDCAAVYSEWRHYGDTYTVPENQYSTRFFFAAAVSITDRLNAGNFIDNVRFSEQMPYTIEYYVQNDNGQFDKWDDLTETNIGMIDSIVSASNKEDPSLSAYTLSYAKLNENDIDGTSFRLQPVKKNGNTENPVLRLYYVKSGIAVTKNVTGLNSKLTASDREDLLNNYRVTIDLYTEASCVNKVATATIELAGNTQSTGMFMDAVNPLVQFAPVENTVYYAKEADAPSLSGHTLVTDVPHIQKVEVGSPALENITITNVYEPVGEVVTDKTVSEGDSTEELWLTLEAYVSGKTITISDIEPMDIVFLLDQSASMHKPEMATDNLSYRSDWGVTNANGTGVYNKTQFEQLVALDVQNNYEKSSLYCYWIARADGVGSSDTSSTGPTGEGEWYKIQYNTTTNKWDLTRCQATNAYDGWGIYDTTSYDSIDDFPSYITKFYVSQYGRMYESVVDFVETLQTKGDDHRVAVVGFAGYGTHPDSGELYDETGCSYIVGNNKIYPDDVTSKEDYLNLFMNTDDSRLMQSVKSVNSKYSGTCTAKGFDMVNNLLSNVPANGRERVVLLITDGDPYNKLDNNGLVAGRDTSEEQAADNAIYYSKHVKQQATVYTIGTVSGLNKVVLDLMSSKYPSAINTANTGNPIEGTYSFHCEDSSELNSVFKTITNTVVEPLINLDEESILQDVISEHFVLDETSDRTVSVSVAAYNGTGFNAAEQNDISENCVITRLDKDGNETNVAMDVRTIQVTNFDYSEHCVVEGSVGGYKLVVKIPIKAADSNNGGTELPTNNDDDTGIYDEDEEIEEFPDPYADVPTTVKINKIVNGSDTTEEFAFAVEYEKLIGYKEGTLTNPDEDDSNYLTADKEATQAERLLANGENGEDNIVKDVVVGSTITVSEDIYEAFVTRVNVSYDGKTYASDSTITLEDGSVIEIITSNTGRSVTINNVQPGMEITFTNTMLYELPSTGSHGIYLYLIAGVVLLMGGTTIIYKKRCKEVLRRR